MPFDMYGDVILTRDVPEHGVRAGDIGGDAIPCVVELHHLGDTIIAAAALNGSYAIVVP